MTNEVLQKIASDEQNISSSNGLEPKLRFKEFDGKWSRNILGNCCDIIMGQSPDSSSYNNNCIGLPLVQGNADMCERIATPQRYTSQPTKICEAGSIILSVRAPVGTVGKTFQKICLGRGVCGITSKNIEFMYQYLLNNENSWRHIEQGGTFTAINSDDIKSFPIILPSLPEQKKIADFLSLIDQRIEKQRQLVENLKKYKRGLLSAIFDHKLRFKDENGNDYPEWDNFVLDNLGSFYNGLSGKNKDDFGTGNSEYITYMNVFKNTIANETICERVNILPNEHQNIVNFGDLLFTQSSETMEEVGFCSVWNSHKKVFLNSFCFGLHFNNSKFAYPQFMAHYMRSYKIRLLIMRESQGATRINLSSERLKKIELSLPPYKEQKIIAHFIERYDNTIQNEEKKLEMFNNLKQGLLQQMFI